MAEHNNQGSTWIPYVPDRISSPGETLRETLEALPLSQSDLAVRTGLSTKHISQIVLGTAALTHETAIKLERATGVPARLWNSLESQYRDWQSRASERESLAGSLDWLKQMPVAALRKSGIIQATHHDRETQLQEILEFFGVASVGAWRAAWAEPSAAFLQSAAFIADAGAVAAWLRLGELEASKLAVQPFDKAALRAILPKLRALTVLEPDVFWPQVQELCARAGVAIVLIPEVTGARASGATRWLSPSKALVQLSLRHKRNDHFWFALFHELAHVLLHGKKDVFVEHSLGKDGGRLEAEKQANDFAARTLIPLEADALIENVHTYSEVKTLASKLGIHPGIVAGRIQHDRNKHTFGVPGLFASLIIVSADDSDQ
ncbi:addiction module antidote protein, HigA family [Cryobacterium glaciale]|uniref:Addiction module antidote protein, HigA family n=1 Tax=Cryobacterium glaciale TaxID=1259145 RepID=A0A4V3I8K2_9MICO|nr:HigA family addiction module antitoxin [Cryobacterium glaciale]TFB75307.1 addiction module antidote protein, HigA family [Cryobacterium glaciale]